jgi:hypothetical protein
MGLSNRMPQGQHKAAFPGLLIPGLALNPIALSNFEYKGLLKF